MGCQAQADDDEDWYAADEIEPGDDPGEDADIDVPSPGGPRRAIARQVRIRRLIEQAREKRELGRSIADFEDFVL
jgi:hypothetical protein